MSGQERDDLGVPLDAYYAALARPLNPAVFELGPRRRDVIEWEGFGYSWEIHAQATPMRALALDDHWLVGCATARTRAGLIFAMWRTARRARRRTERAGTVTYPVVPKGTR